MVSKPIYVYCLIYFYKVKDGSLLINKQQATAIARTWVVFNLAIHSSNRIILPFLHRKYFVYLSIFSGVLFFCCFLCSGSAPNSRSSTQMNSYSDSGYQEVSGYYSNTVTPRRSEGRSQSTSSAPSGSPTLAMSSRAEGQASAQV